MFAHCYSHMPCMAHLAEVALWVLAAGPGPHLCAGGPSMMMLTHRICMALRGLGRLHTVDSVMRLRAEMLLRGTHRAHGWLLADTQHPRPCRRWPRNLRAQLKSDEIFDVVKNPLAFLHCIPAGEKVFTHEGPGRRVPPAPSAAEGSDAVTRTGHLAWSLVLFAGFPGDTPIEDDNVLTGAISHWGLVPKPLLPFCPD